MIFKNCALFTNCMTEINNKQVENPKNFDIVMLIEFLLNAYRL